MREGAELRRARIKKRFAPCQIEMAVGRFKANPEPQSLSSCVSYEHADDLVGPVFLGCADLPRFRFATFALVEFVNELDPPFWQRFIDDGVMALDRKHHPPFSSEVTAQATTNRRTSVTGSPCLMSDLVSARPA